VTSDAAPKVVISLDELESLRLADLEGLYQQQAATLMGVSRATFGRILGAAHRKVAEALVFGHALTFEKQAAECGIRQRCEQCHKDDDDQNCRPCNCRGRAATADTAATPTRSRL
jgi:predicted DNA-binding protein (UPF0251 family)